jgi:hypothetical protein
MRVRDRLLLCAMAAAVLAAAVAYGVAVVGPDALIAVPALLLVLPLAAGRYVGSERLVRIVRRVAPWRPRRAARPIARGLSSLRPCARGGLLIAVSLGRRGPPAASAAAR